MDRQLISNAPNRREFLKQSALGAAALAGLPSLDNPLWAAALGKASRIEAVEALVLERNGEQRRVLKVISNSGAAGFADFPDFDYVPSLGGVAKEHLIGANPYAVEAIWAKMRQAGVLISHRTAVDYALWDLMGRDTGKPVYELLGGPVRDRIRIYHYGRPGRTKNEYDEDEWRDLGRRLAQKPGAAVKTDPFAVSNILSARKLGSLVSARATVECRPKRISPLTKWFFAACLKGLATKWI